MGIGSSLENFNRIIDLVFIPKEASLGVEENNLPNYSVMTNKYSKVKSIICPRHGIKPQIEINGVFGTALELEAFHITIKNLYLDLRTEQYSQIKVRAGYANNYIDFEAEIWNMYQDTPGPEGTTVIECKRGHKTQQWLDSIVDLNYEKGESIMSVLNKIKTSLNASGLFTGDAVKSLKLETKFQWHGSARGALDRLTNMFTSKNLQFIMQGSNLCAVCLTDGDFINHRVLKYMSAPPQQNPGNKDGNWSQMITAPWMPDLLPGDKLEIPSFIYYHDRRLVGGTKKTQTLQITQMSFHFGTRGSVNQMTCSGFIVR